MSGDIRDAGQVTQPHTIYKNDAQSLLKQQEKDRFVGILEGLGAGIALFSSSMMGYRLSTTLKSVGWHHDAYLLLGNAVVCVIGAHDLARLSWHDLKGKKVEQIKIAHTAAEEDDGHSHQTDRASLKISKKLLKCSTEIFMDVEEHERVMNSLITYRIFQGISGLISSFTV